MTSPTRARAFSYLGVQVEASASSLTARFDSDGTPFEEVATFHGDVDLDAPGVAELAELWAMLAGLSYYKTGAARHVGLGPLPAGPAARSLLGAALSDGLAEFSYQSGVGLDDVEVEGGPTSPAPVEVTAVRGALVPFGGGIDSIVTAVEFAGDDAALFVVSPSAEPFAAIGRPAALTGLPVLHCTRRLDPKLLSGRRAGWFDGHVPVTAMLSALALVAAAATRRSAVVMSNERSASSPNLVVDGRAVNHQWSKSMAAEELLRAAVRERVGAVPDYFSALRDRSELWVARELAARPEYLPAFMSCNRAFRQDPRERATTWCGQCDKCLFIDLVLAPFVDRAVLEDLFGGHEPLGDPARSDELAVLAGIVENPKPFECVGDVVECATALVATASRRDRAGQAHLSQLAARCERAVPLEELLVPSGPTNAPVRDAARDHL